MMDYRKLAEQFFLKSHQMKKFKHQQMLDESLQGEIITLLFINDKKDYVLPGEISTEMKISSARVATILNNLENKDFILRQIDETDRRRILVSLTKKGKEQAQKHKEKVINDIAKMLKLLGEEDAKELIRITSKIVDLFSEIDNDIKNI